MKRLAHFILPGFVAIVVLCAFAWAVVYSLIFRDLPEIYALEDYRPNLITRIEAADGTLVGQLALERRIIVPIEEVPEYLVQAFIAAEDDSFYTHEGLDYPSILRAAWANLKAGGVAQGGSTITQQVGHLAGGHLVAAPRRLAHEHDAGVGRHVQPGQGIYDE